MIVQMILLIISILLLWLGSNYLVESASRIADKLGISELVIGLTVVALGTSSPEFAVTFTAAFKGYSNISVGNIVGSNIFNLGFILGAVAIVKTIQTSYKLVYRDGLLMIGSTLLLLLFFYDRKLTASEGMILVFTLIGYLLFLFSQREILENDKILREKATLKDAAILPISIIAIIAGGHILVESGSSIARTLGLSEWIIGITIVAAGTSAPEMATSLSAALRDKHGICAGNLIGSNLFNILGVLGLAGILKPLVIESSALYSLILLSLMTTLVIVFLRTGWRLTRIEGFILILIGLSLWIFLM